MTSAKTSIDASTVEKTRDTDSTSSDIEKQLSSENSEIAINNDDSDNTATQPVQMTKLKRLIIFIALAFTMLLANLDITITTTAIPKISQEFTALSSATWIATAYMLTTTALQPLYGRISDIFGRLPTIIFAILIFSAGSAICGGSKSIGVLIFGRTVQGVGAAGLVSLVFIIISDMTTEEERPAYLGAIGAVWSLASVLGPVLGGVFSEKVTWRWGFLVNLPVAAVVLTVISFLLRLPKPKGSFKEKIKKVDFLGSLVLIGAVVMILLALTWAGKSYPWSSARVICLLVFGVLLLGVFLIIEWKTSAVPTVPIHLFANRNVAVSVIGQLFMGVGMFAPMFFIPIWYTIVKNAGSIAAGLHLLPYLLGMSLISIASGIFVMKTGRYREIIWIGTALFVTGTGLISLFDEELSSSKQIAFLFLTGFGLGLNVQTLLIVSQTAAGKKDMAATTTLFLFMRILGASIGLAILQSVLQNDLIPKLTTLANQYPKYKLIFAGSLNDQTLIYNSGLPDAVRIQLVHSFVESLRKVFIAVIPFVSVAFLLTLPLKHIPLRKLSEPDQTSK